MSKSEKSLVMKVGEFKMHLDHLKRGISGVLWGQGYREPCFMWIVNKEAYGKVGIDIGANLGYVTLYMCKNLKKVIAIEPDKRCRKLLKKNLEENGFRKNVKIKKFAISDSCGEEVIYLAKKNPNLNSLCNGKKLLKKKDLLGKKTIKTQTIDSLNESPEFIKMDIEGYEVEAIMGGIETFKRVDKCKILIEVHPQYYDKERDFSVVLKTLFDIGFRVKYVVSAGCECPDLFKERGYSPFKVMKDGGRKRGIFRGVSFEDAVDFCSFQHIQKSGDDVSMKIARAILLVKGN